MEKYMEKSEKIESIKYEKWVKGVGNIFERTRILKFFLKNVKVGVRVSFRKNVKVGVRVSVGVWEVI